MSDWVFCNKCSLKYQSNGKFYLSECGHIFCEKCVIGCKQECCTFCHKAVKLIEIGKNMDNETQMFFWPLEGFFQKFAQVFQFQNKHKGMLEQAMAKKYSFCKKECIHYYNAHKKLKQENEILRAMLESNGIYPNQFLVTSTPNSKNQTFDNNLSMVSSVKFTPGYAQRVNDYRSPLLPSAKHRQIQHQQRYKGYVGGDSVTLSENDEPSPAQMVPNRSRKTEQPAPTHGQPSRADLAVQPPAFMDKLRQYVITRGNPKK